MLLIKPALLVGREYFYFTLLLLAFLGVSLSFEYYHFSKLTAFDDAVVEVSVLKHYEKVQGGERYEVLKLVTDDGAKFYMTSTAPLKVLAGYRAKVWLLTKYVSFFEYMKGFAVKGKVTSVSRVKSDAFRLGDILGEIHQDDEVSQLYGALFLALPLSNALQEQFSRLGVSHLLAISGFHLGVLTFVIIGLLYFPYTKLQMYYFPYRHRSRDLFIIAATILGIYLYFLGDVASLLRAYAMLLVGYLLHDRGLKVLSLQTLVLTVVLLLALMPRLLFSLGFWLSVSGVYAIFLYLHYYKTQSKYVSFILVPLWVYVVMTPVSLVVFGNYSLLHPLSTIWSILFTIFYPLALFIHLLGIGTLFDGFLMAFIHYEMPIILLSWSPYWLFPYGFLALSAFYHRWIFWFFTVVAFGVSITAIYEVAQT